MRHWSESFILIKSAIVAGGFAINDYYDRDVDATYKRNRPIPSGRIRPEKAKVIGYLLLVAGLILAVLALPPLSVFIATTCAFLLDLYSRVLKRKHTIIGNFVTSYSTAITYIFGWSCLLGVLSGKIVLTLFWMFILSLLVCLGREFIKSIQDLKGDKEFNINTIAVKYGVGIAAYSAAAPLILAVILSPLPYVFNLFGFSYLVIIIIVDIMLLVSSFLLIRKIRKIGDREPIFNFAKKIKESLLVAMVVGLFAFSIGLFI